MTRPEAPPAWHPAWEEAVYGKGRHLNRYPYHAVVGFVLSEFGGVPDRSAVRILELGCGAGNNLWFAAREGFSAAGIDGSPTAVAYAARRFADEGLRGDLRVGDFTALPWEDAAFDLVVDRCSLTHSPVAAIRAALGEARRVLKPGGKLLSVVYSDQHPGRADPTGGYFAGLGTVSFLSLSDVTDIYGGPFELLSATHTTEEERLGAGGRVNAFWKVVARRRA